MAMKVVCAILVILPVIVLCASVSRGSDCITPNNEKAKCTPITSCKIIADAIRNRSQGVIEFAKASQCGYDTEALVCCGTSSAKVVVVKKIERGSACKTPNGESATCTAFRSCKVIVDALQSQNQTAIEFAKSSQCGYDTEPLVCCGSTGSPKLPPTISLSPFLPDRSSCGSVKSFRVFGGELTQIGEHPWAVLLGYKNSDGTDAGFQCGGTIINNRYVLTAAHCVAIGSNKGIKLDSVRLGEWKISTSNDCDKTSANIECSDPVIDSKIEEEIVHEQYERKSGKNDIALLRLEKNVTFSDYIQPICLPEPNATTPNPGKKFIIVGWGATENSSTSDDKLKVEVPIVPLSDCVEKLRNRRREITEDQVCAGGVPGKDSCGGDSGGPLMGSLANEVGEKDQWYQEGLVSWGVGCGAGGYPGVYTRVARYMTWLIGKLK